MRKTESRNNSVASDNIQNAFTQQPQELLPPKLTLSIKSAEEITITRAAPSRVKLSEESANDMRAYILRNLHQDKGLWEKIIIKDQQGKKLNPLKLIIDAAMQVSEATAIEDGQYLHAIIQYLYIAQMQPGNIRDSLLEAFGAAYNGKVIGGTGDNSLDAASYHAFTSLLAENAESTESNVQREQSNALQQQNAQTTGSTETTTSTESTNKHRIIDHLKSIAGVISTKLSEHNIAATVVAVLSTCAFAIFEPSLFGALFTINVLAIVGIAAVASYFAYYAYYLSTHPKSNNTASGSHAHKFHIPHPAVRKMLRNTAHNTLSDMKKLMTASLTFTAFTLAIVAAGFAFAVVATLGVAAFSGQLIYVAPYAFSTINAFLGNGALVIGTLLLTAIPGLASIRYKTKSKIKTDINGLYDREYGISAWLSRHKPLIMGSLALGAVGVILAIVNPVFTLSEFVTGLLIMPWAVTTYSFSKNLVKWLRSNERRVRDIVLNHKRLTIFDAILGASAVEYGIIPILAASPLLSLVAIWPIVMYLGKRHLAMKEE